MESKAAVALELLNCVWSPFSVYVTVNLLCMWTCVCLLEIDERRAREPGEGLEKSLNKSRASHKQTCRFLWELYFMFTF